MPSKKLAGAFCRSQNMRHLLGYNHGGLYIYIILIKLHVMGFGSRPTDHLNDPFLSSDSVCVCNI